MRPSRWVGAQIVAFAAASVPAGIPLETLDRFEICGASGQMIRAYSAQYVAGLAHEHTTPASSTRRWACDPCASTSRAICYIGTLMISSSGSGTSRMASVTP